MTGLPEAPSADYAGEIGPPAGAGPDGSTGPDGPDGSPSAVPAWLELALRVAGGVVAVGLAAVSAVYEAFLTPLSWQWSSGGQAHMVRVPLALVCAVIGNIALAWFTNAVTGKLIMVVLPFLAWCTPMLLASARTGEGDLVLTGNNWVGLTTLFVGALAFGGTAYWIALRPIRRPG